MKKPTEETLVSDLSTPPAWLELPDEKIEPKKVQLWTVHGEWAMRRWPWQKKVNESEYWSVLYTTSEEAVADANANSDWKWNGLPPHTVTLSESMLSARVRGRLGVRIGGYRDGEWVTGRYFPADVPLMGDEVIE